MRISMIIRLLSALTELLTADMIRAFFLAGAEALEKIIIASPNKIDDTLCLGLIAKIKGILDAPEETA